MIRLPERPELVSVRDVDEAVDRTFLRSSRWAARHACRVEFVWDAD
jgi:hypothetical protein